MNSDFEVCITLDLTETMDILNDYFGITLPHEHLVGQVIMRSGQLLGEVIDGSISDTYACDLLIRQVVKSLPNSEGKEWPTYGTAEALSKEFYTWFAEAIKTVGGTFGRNRQPFDSDK